MQTVTESEFDMLSPRQQKELIDWYFDLAEWLAAEMEAGRMRNDAAPTPAAKTRKASKKAKKGSDQ